MSDYTIEQIMRAIAKGERNSVGDYWSKHWCENAANEIERLRAERDALAAELRAIRDASPKAWELPIVDFCEEFRAWAQSRARAALAKLEGKQ